MFFFQGEAGGAMAVHRVSLFFEDMFASNQAGFYFFVGQVYEFAECLVFWVYVVVAVLRDFDVF